MCQVVSVSYVVAVTVMCVLLFVLHLSMAMVTVMCGGCEGVVVVSAGHEYVGGTHGSGIVSSTFDVLGI